MSTTWISVMGCTSKTTPGTLHSVFLTNLGKVWLKPAKEERPVKKKDSGAINLTTGSCGPEPVTTDFTPYTTDC